MTTAARLQRAQAVFDQLLELPPPERLAALDDACGGDAALARDVRSLLAHAERLDGFLDQPALGARVVPPADGLADELVGRALGRYVVERRIASGGMGIVYLAVQADGQLARRVALKVVKRGLDTEEILQRFRRERQTLARLDHPNIARLLDGGATSSGQPWLAMEYVEGEPIDEWCRARRLDLRRRLELFLSVCDAVRYAHQNLVVHRDLKPGNILVTAHGVPKLLDFGIAVVLQSGGSAASTAPQERRWTPEYASPEQVAGLPVSTATDVYSLGVILHHLLCGRSPRRVASGGPDGGAAGCPALPPSEALGDGDAAADDAARERGLSAQGLARRLRGDLDTIVLTAIHPDPLRRYASVERLADDLRRHLDGRPVQARRDTLRYRLGKFVRRHAVGTGLGALALLLLSGGVVAVAWQARIAARQRDEAFVARDQSTATTTFLQDMLASADPGAQGPEVTVHEVLDAASGRIDGELAGQPFVQASLRGTIGRTYVSLGLYDEAEPVLRQALAQRVALLGPRHHDVAQSAGDLAALLYARGALDEAAVLLAGALDIFREVRGELNPDTARALSSLGAVRRAQGRLEEAESLQREALSIRREVSGAGSLDAAESLNNLAGVLLSGGRFDEAQDALTEALAIRRERLGHEHPLVSQSIDNLAVLLHRRGDLDAAEPLYREALAAGSARLGATHPDVAITQKNLAMLLRTRGDLAAAEVLLRSCLATREARFPPADARVLLTRLDLAAVLAERDAWEQAAPLVEASVSIAQGASCGAETRAQVLGRAADLVEARGDPVRAVELRAQAGP